MLRIPAISHELVGNNNHLYYTLSNQGGFLSCLLLYYVTFHITIISIIIIIKPRLISPRKTSEQKEHKEQIKETNNNALTFITHNKTVLYFTHY